MTARPFISQEKLRRSLLFRYLYALGGHSEGYWWCYDCEKVTEREEGEQGRPAHCNRCQSHRIRYVEATRA